MDIPPWLGDKLYPFSHFLGYRRLESYRPNEPVIAKDWRSRAWIKKTENIVQTFIGAWVGLTFVGAPAWRGYSVPTVVGSFGAEAVLLYAAPTSPMAQPRNIILGMALSSIIGVGIAKLFALQDKTAFPMYEWDWAAASTTVAITLAVTQALEVPHPPGGASALLAATNQQIVKLGWFYVGYVMVGSVIMLSWGMIINNVGIRRYPQYWISPSLVYEHTDGDQERMNKAPGSAKPSEQQG